MIINAAVMSQDREYSVKEIAQEVVLAQRAGASIVHFHCKNAGEYKEVVGAVRNECDVILCGSTSESIEDRFACIGSGVEMASLSIGSWGMGSKRRINPWCDTLLLAESMKKEGVRPEVELFSESGFGDLWFLMSRGIVAERPYVNFFLLDGAFSSFYHNKEAFGAIMSCAGIGAYQLPANALAVTVGCHCRTGVEDNAFMSYGVPANNQSLIERLRVLAEASGRKIFSSSEARAVLGL